MEHHKGARAIESALAAKQCAFPKTQSKYCTNCKRMNHTTSGCWEEGGGNYVNTLNWGQEEWWKHVQEEEG